MASYGSLATEPEPGRLLLTMGRSLGRRAGIGGPRFVALPDYGSLARRRTMVHSPANDWTRLGFGVDDVSLAAALHELASEDPDRVAVDTGHERVTYAGLERRANEVARAVIDRHAGDAPVSSNARELLDVALPAARELGMGRVLLDILQLKSAVS